MHNDKKDSPKIVKACVITLGTVLILATAFTFLAFKTDYIFNFKTDSRVTSEAFDRTSVTTVIEEINDLESAPGGELVPEIEDVADDWWYTPKAGETVPVSFGIDVAEEQRTVNALDSWSIEYSIQGCISAYGESALCTRRLLTAADLYGVNDQESGDLLKLNVEGTECFAGAMIEPPFTVGDVVLVELENGTQFNFLLLDVKSKSHTYAELGNGSQVQCEWGHGYPSSDGSVQLSVCEFMCNQDRGGQSSAKMLPSGAFLDGQKVMRAKIIKHVDIDGSLTSTKPLPGVPPEPTPSPEPEPEPTPTPEPGPTEPTEPEPTPEPEPPPKPQPPLTAGNYNITEDIANGVYTEEDIRYMASAMTTETSDYNSAVAIGSAIRNRVNGDAWWSSGKRTIKAVCTKEGQMNGKYLELSAIDTMYLQAAAYILHGGESNIGGHTSWFGRVNGYDLWADAGASFYNWGNNVFHSGGAHNKKGTDTPAGGVCIYNHNTQTWNYPSGTGIP